jgi:hypothetical protein
MTPSSGKIAKHPKHSWQHLRPEVACGYPTKTPRPSTEDRLVYQLFKHPVLTEDVEILIGLPVGAGGKELLIEAPKPPEYTDRSVSKLLRSLKKEL